MMFNSSKKISSKILAVFLALIMLMSIIPEGTLVTALASTVDRYTVTLTEGTDTVNLDDVQVTLTNKSDSQKSVSQMSVDGVAVFENFVEEDETYIVSVAESIGYETITDFDITPVVGDINTDVALIAIGKVMISGKVVDEENNPYDGAKVSLSGYKTDEATTNSLGEYSFEAYIGKDYTIKATAKEQKYEIASTSINNLSAYQPASVLELKVKQYVITTLAGANGTITATESGVEYGSTRKIEIVANEGYRIDTLVGGGDSSEAHGKQTYSFDLTDIKENKEVSVTFYKQTYKVSFDVSANGEVTYNTNATAEGGKVTDFTVDENGTVDFKAIANTTDGYHVERVSIGDDVRLADGTNENEEYIDTVSSIKKDVTVTVVFELNNYSVSVGNGANGTITIDSEEIKSEIADYGSDVTVSVAANDGYYLSKFEVDGANKLTEISETDLFEYAINNINSDVQIDVEFSKKEIINVESPISNDYFEITFSNPFVEKNGTYIVGKDGTLTITSKDGKKIRAFKEQHIWFSSYYNTYDVGIIKYTSNKDINNVEVKDENKWKSIPTNVSFIVDTTAPTISDVKKDPDKDFNNDEYIVTATVTDDNAGVEKVYYSSTNDFSTASVANYDSATNKAEFKTDKEEYNDKYYIWAVDKVGNLTVDNAVKSISIAIDNTKPTVDKFEFSSNLLNILDYGTFSNDDITVLITASDTASTKTNSGVASITFNGQTVKATEFTGGKAKFVLNKADFANTKEVKATAIDNAGNLSEIAIPTTTNSNVKSNKITISETKAKIETDRKYTALYEDGEKYWYAGNSDFAVKITDDFGIKSVLIKMNGKEVVNETCDNGESTVKAKEYSINTSEEPKDGKNEITVEVVNVTNNKSDNKDSESKIVYIDTTAPDITNFEVTSGGVTVLSKFFNFLSFGVFFNDKIEVTVTADDTNASSGINSITLFADGEKFETKEVVDNKATFIIPVEEITDEKMHFNKVLSAKATDNVNNTTAKDVMPTTENSNIKNSSFMIETVKPTVDVQFDEAAGDWYSSNVEFAVTAKDADSGLRNVIITINDRELVNEDLYESEVHKKEYSVNTKDAVIKDDGSYTLKIVVTDNAGNVYNTYTKTIFKDVDKPYITGFDFEPANYIEGSETASTVEVTDYGFYFREDTKVTIFSKDDAPSSGIKSITYYTVDKDKGKSSETVTVVNAKGEIEFTIKANFKGQIYAKATDNVDNVQTDFVNPNSTIVEDESKHNEEDHISFKKNKTSFSANNGTELYANDVPVTITVTDTYSGIREIEWEVVAPYDTDNNQKGKVALNNDKTFADGSDANWRQLKSEANLVTEIQKTITVSNNSNDIVVKVKMTDRAGNTSEKSIKISIDKTKPVIEASYDNNVPDETYNDIYKANRTATVRITERNFNGKDVAYMITNTDGSIAQLSNWEEHKNTENPDETYYIASIAYTADGDYTFDISYSDRAQNAAAKFAQHTFTIDKTIPTVTVSYDNNTALNGNYYKTERTATITIVEHNFDSSRVNVVGTANDNGVTLSFPATSTWSNNGDTHIATINYASDSKYTIDIEFLDMAGNSIVDYTPEEFFVDKTAPSLEISGVEDKSAKNGTVAPVITYTDANFNKDNVTVELSGVSNNKVNYAALTEDIENGQRITYADFEKIQKVDDIYTLTVTLTDMAGNETTKTIVFSANRFGSVYTFDSSLEAIEGKYINTERDIVFTETNVDTLDRESINVKLVKNGTPSDLKEGTDFTIEVSGGNGQWSQYRYVVKESLFEGDGNYRLTIYSKDAAGNVNENIDESKKAEISFGIDKTNPIIVPIDFVSGEQYPVEVKTVKVEIKDNLVLDSVKIYLNGNEVEYYVEGEIYTFDIPEGNEKQNVEFVAIDAARNEYKLPIENFLVSTNIFVRWYNNTPLFIGSIIGVVALGIGLTALIVFGKKKKKENKK